MIWALASVTAWSTFALAASFSSVVASGVWSIASFLALAASSIACLASDFLITSGWIALIVVVPFVFASSTPELFIASLIWPLASVTAWSTFAFAASFSSVVASWIRSIASFLALATSSIASLAFIFFVISGWIALIKFVPFILAVSTFSFFSAWWICSLALVTSWSIFAIAASFSSTVASGVWSIAAFLIRATSSIVSLASDFLTTSGITALIAVIPSFCASSTLELVVAWLMLFLASVTILSTFAFATSFSSIVASSIKSISCFLAIAAWSIACEAAFFFTGCATTCDISFTLFSFNISISLLWFTLLISAFALATKLSISVLAAFFSSKVALLSLSISTFLADAILSIAVLALLRTIGVIVAAFTLSILLVFCCATPLFVVSFIIFVVASDTKLSIVAFAASFSSTVASGLLSNSTFLAFALSVNSSIAACFTVGVRSIIVISLIPVSLFVATSFEVIDWSTAV